jgi:hypothetical protein
MTIRGTILLATVPLFVVLALVNGALLHLRERAELARALDGQALAATVTVAEFLRDRADARADLTQPVRARALRTALARAEGLDGLYLIEPGRAPLAIARARTPWDPATIALPARPAATTDLSHRWVTAAAPAGAGRFVTARFDARPIARRMDTITREIAATALLAGLFAIALGLWLARRITRELARNHGVLAGEPTDAPFRIRETRDLADAVRLMHAGDRAAEDHHRRDQDRKLHGLDLVQALTAARAAFFAPASIAQGPVEIALRICGDAPWGSFFAHCFTASGGVVVLGRCTAPKAIDALALANTLRGLIERQNDGAVLRRLLDKARTVYGLEALAVHEWRHGDRAALFAVADDLTRRRVETYRRASPGVAPAALLAGLDIMLAPTGVFASVGSADGGERGRAIGRDGEDAAEPADHENLVN